MNKVLKILNYNCITIKYDKFEWGKNELDFFGLHFSHKGISLNESKTEALMNTKRHENN